MRQQRLCGTGRGQEAFRAADPKGCVWQPVSISRGPPAWSRLLPCPGPTVRLGGGRQSRRRAAVTAAGGSHGGGRQSRRRSAVTGCDEQI